MLVAAKDGLDGRVEGQSLREMARRALSLAVAGLEGGAACAGNPAGPVRHLERLAARHKLNL
jgi:hypothetical protein